MIPIMGDINTLVSPILNFDSEKNHSMGIVLTNTGSENLHCGIAYKYDGRHSIIHLAWHFDLRNEDISEDESDYFWIISKIHPIRQIMIANKCNRILEIKNENFIPYAVLYEGAEFNDEGVLLLGNNEHGLTCATFVLSVFKSCGIDLVCLSAWPNREEDIIWHKKIISLLEEHKERYSISEDHIDNVREEIGCSRFRPEEVASSSTFNNVPAPFEKISARGVLLKKHVIETI